MSPKTVLFFLAVAFTACGPDATSSSRSNQASAGRDLRSIPPLVRSLRYEPTA